MSDDLQAVRQELARWVAANDLDAIKDELARRGLPVDDPSPVDVEFVEVVAEVKRRLLAAELNPLHMLGEAMTQLAATLASIAAAPPRPPVAPVVVETVERDADGLIPRIIEEVVVERD